MHWQQQPFYVSPRSVCFDSLFNQVGMIICRSGCGVPDEGSSDPSCGVPFIAFDIRLRSRAGQAPSKRNPSTMRQMLATARLPVLNNARRPIAEATSLTSIEKNAPASGVAVAFANARKSMKPTGLDYIGWCKSGDPNRVAKLRGYIMHHGALRGG
ncbi:MAG: hypothetical protein OSB10_02155 [Planctomycetota bacterium]|nr:hypothetical protein [Planctomycetota bacterium]